MEGMKTTYLSVTDTAKLIRKALKRNFGKFKFSVRSKSYSGGASINVSWLDGPKEDEVSAVVTTFEGADFDPMQDLKTYNHTIVSNPDGTLSEISYGADFVFTNRMFSKEAMQKGIEIVKKKYNLEGDFEPQGSDTYGYHGIEPCPRIEQTNNYMQMEIGKELSKLDLRK